MLFLLGECLCEAHLWGMTEPQVDAVEWEKVGDLWLDLGGVKDPRREVWCAGLNQFSIEDRF